MVKWSKWEIRRLAKRGKGINAIKMDQLDVFIMVVDGTQIIDRQLELGKRAPPEY